MSEGYDPLASVRWFSGEPLVIDGRWRCPRRGCDGTMVSVGLSWPVSDVGYHHGCDRCGLALAIPRSAMEQYGVTLEFSMYSAGIVEGIRRATATAGQALAPETWLSDPWDASVEAERLRALHSPAAERCWARRCPIDGYVEACTLPHAHLGDHAWRVVEGGWTGQAGDGDPFGPPVRARCFFCELGAVATCRIVGAPDAAAARAGDFAVRVEIPHCAQHGPEALAEALR